MTRLSRSLICAAALCALATVALAHGDDEAMDVGGMGMDMDMDMSSGAATAAASSVPTVTHNIAPELSYFSYPDEKVWIWAHVAVMIVAWGFIAPIGMEKLCSEFCGDSALTVIAVFLSIAKSRYAFPWQTLFVLANAVGVLLSIIYDSRVPDLYEHNVHYRMGWLFTWFTLAWVFMGLVNMYSRRLERRRHSGQQMSAANMAHYHRINQINESQVPRWSRDSGQGTERNSASLLGSNSNGTGSPSTELEEQHFDIDLPPYQHATDEQQDDEPEKRSFLRNTPIDRFLSKKIPKYATGRILSINKWSYIFFERTMLIFGWFAITSGFVVFGGLAVRHGFR